MIERNSDAGIEPTTDPARAGLADDIGGARAAADHLTREVVNQPETCIAVQANVPDLAVLDQPPRKARSGPAAPGTDDRQCRPGASIVRLYDGALAALRQASDSLDAGTLDAAVSLRRAAEIFGELQEAIDRERDPEIAEHFVTVYSYCRRRIMDAHLTVEAAPLRELLTLLTPLRDAWAGIQQSMQVAP